MTSNPSFPSMPCMAPFDLVTRFFQGLPRKGPGSERSTRRALAICRDAGALRHARPWPADPAAPAGGLAPEPAVADFGCGSGAATLVLAGDLQVPVLGLDADGRSLDDLWQFAQARGLGGLVRPRCADMAQPGLPPASLDLLWSEGAISHVGWQPGLAAWRDLVRSGGCLAITDAVWFTGDPPAAAREFWAPWYPSMATVPRQLQAARDLGLAVVDHFALPGEDWWAYFDPVAARCRDWAGRPEFAELIALMAAERDLYRHHGHSYGYEFFILKRE